MAHAPTDAVWPLGQFPADFQDWLVAVHKHFLTTSVRNHIHLWVFMTPDGAAVSVDKALPVQVLAPTADSAYVQVTAATAQALDWLHAAGIAHVDLHVYVDNWNTLKVVRGQPARVRRDLQLRVQSRLRAWQGRWWASMVDPRMREAHPAYQHAAHASSSSASSSSSSASSASSSSSSGNSSTLAPLPFE